MCNSSLHNEYTFYGQFCSDLASCTQEVIIESSFITSRRMSLLFPIFRRLCQRNVRVYIMTRDPREHEPPQPAIGNCSIIESMQNEKKEWKTLESQIVFDNPWYRLRKDKVQLPNGTIVGDYFVSELPSVVMIVGITSSQEVIMVKQYRYGVKKTLLELPAGTFDQNNEKPVEAAEREFLEETGYRCKNFVLLGTLFEYPTKDSHQIHVFFSDNVEKEQAPILDNTEDIELVVVPLNTIPASIVENKIQVSGSIAALFMALQYLNKLQFK